MLKDFPLIKIRDLSFYRGNKLIFDGIHFDIFKGKITVIMGPSGSGKTTLLRLIGGQLLPNSGFVKVKNVNICKFNRKLLYKFRKNMGMMFQSGALFSDLSVFDNVAFPIRENTNLPEWMIRDLVIMKLQIVGLRGTINLMPSELSVGMTKRVALARAIALDPDIIMYDEPFAGQDPISTGVLLRLIKLLNDTLGMTSIIVSHEIHETVSIADYICLISNGHVVASDSIGKLVKNNSPWVEQFINGFPDGPIKYHYFSTRNYVEDFGIL